MGRDEGRKQRKRVTKMVALSDCYIVIVWKNPEKTPLCFLDAGRLKTQKTPVATSFGEIMNFVSGSIANCIKKADMNQAQLSQAEHAEMLKEKRSEMYEAASRRTGKEEEKAGEARDESDPGGVRFRKTYENKKERDENAA